MPDKLTEFQQRLLTYLESTLTGNLILGAWGCGVFKNHPPMVADAFGAWLDSARFASAFNHVTFAIYCPGTDKAVLKAFQERFKK